MMGKRSAVLEEGFEPPKPVGGWFTASMRCRLHTPEWSLVDSNHRRAAFQTAALPSELSDRTAVDLSLGDPGSTAKALSGYRESNPSPVLPKHVCFRNTLSR